MRILPAILLSALLPGTFVARGAIVINFTNAMTGLAFSADISGGDLINAGQPTLALATLPASHSAFPASGLHDGLGTNTVPGGNAYFDIPAHVPGTATFDLDGGANTNGFSLTSIRTVAGWATASQSQANQKYEIHVRTAGAVGYTLLTNVDYSPFPISDGPAYESRVIVTNDSGGPLASNVTSVRFVFQAPTVNGGNFPGTVYREVDVFGHLSVTNPPAATTITLSTPKTRQVVQRNNSGVADLRVQGSLSTANPGAVRIEARAVVMPGTTNNGTSTGWMEIVGSPTNGVFAGVIPGLAAGGWYRVEVRVVDAVSSVLATVGVDRVGVGDVFVTAGQSNSASFGSPAQTPSDDRVSTYTLASSSWLFAVDPQPNNSGWVGTGGSPWPVMGSRMVASNQVPVGFIVLGYGATALTDWAPGTANYQKLTNTLVRFGTNGVRAVLWHQGESDSLASTTATTYAQRMTTMIHGSVERQLESMADDN